MRLLDVIDPDCPRPREFSGGFENGDGSVGIEWL